jgi:hypothetical protein
MLPSVISFAAGNVAAPLRARTVAAVLAAGKVFLIVTPMVDGA